jgi:hypothetical protein
VALFVAPFVALFVVFLLVLLDVLGVLGLSLGSVLQSIRERSRMRAVLSCPATAMSTELLPLPTCDRGLARNETSGLVRNEFVIRQKLSKWQGDK